MSSIRVLFLESSVASSNQSMLTVSCRQLLGKTQRVKAWMPKHSAPGTDPLCSLLTACIDLLIDALHFQKKVHSRSSISHSHYSNLQVLKNLKSGKPFEPKASKGLFPLFSFQGYRNISGVQQRPISHLKLDTAHALQSFTSAAPCCRCCLRTIQWLFSSTLLCFATGPATLISLR